MNVVYLVKGYLTTQEIENEKKRTLYAGTSPKTAFEYMEKYNERADITVEIWEDGNFIREFKQKNVFNF